MKLLLPFVPGKCNPKKIILDFDLTTEYAMGPIIKRGNIYNWEREVFAMLLGICSSLQDIRFIDIGANIGIYSLTVAALYSDNSRVTAVEPTPDLANKIRKISVDNQLSIKIIEKAVTNQDTCNLNFYINKDDSCSSLKCIGNSVINIISVSPICLSSIYEGYNIIKIDTEGTEYDALISGKEDIAKYKPYILVEILNKNNFNLIKNLSDSLDYKIYHLTKDFSINEINEYPTTIKHGEHNYLLASRNTVLPRKEQQLWSIAILNTSDFCLAEYKFKQSQFVHAMDYIRYKLRDLVEFKYLPYGKNWLAFHHYNLPHLIHYEFSFYNKIAIGLHFELKDQEINTRLMNSVYQACMDTPLSNIYKINLLNEKSIKGINIQLEYIQSYTYLDAYASLMHEFICHTLPTLLHICQDFSIKYK